MRFKEIVAFIEKKIAERGQSNNIFLQKQGYSGNTFVNWRSGKRSARIAAVIDILDTLGYDFDIVPKKLPDSVVIREEEDGRERSLVSL